MECSGGLVEGINDLVLIDGEGAIGFTGPVAGVAALLYNVESDITRISA